MTNINSKQLHELMNNGNIHLIDVREAYEHQFGHIKGARNIPVNEIATNFNKYLNKDETYYIICQSGSRSAAVTQYLEQKGYKVVNILGGHSAWPYGME